ncbi:stage II sporulation protein M [Methanobrevibacter sp.]
MKIFEEGFFKRNKKVILISVMIMLISAIAGAGATYLNADGQYNMISSRLSSNATYTGEDLGVDAIEIFIHNLGADLITVVGGFLFSIISIFAVILNGLSIGAPFGVDLPFASASILPHAIIEYFAGALALAIAFKITQLEIKVIKNRNIKDTLKDHEIDIKDILAIFVVMVILLFVAAIIEAHITPIVVIWTFGL